MCPDNDVVVHECAVLPQLFLAQLLDLICDQSSCLLNWQMCQHADLYSPGRYSIGFSRSKQQATKKSSPSPKRAASLTKASKIDDTSESDDDRDEFGKFVIGSQIPKEKAPHNRTCRIKSPSKRTSTSLTGLASRTDLGSLSSSDDSTAQRSLSPSASHSSLKTDQHFRSRSAMHSAAGTEQHSLSPSGHDSSLKTDRPSFSRSAPKTRQSRAYQGTTQAMTLDQIDRLRYDHHDVRIDDELLKRAELELTKSVEVSSPVLQAHMQLIEKSAHSKFPGKSFWIIPSEVWATFFRQDPETQETSLDREKFQRYCTKQMMGKKWDEVYVCCHEPGHYYGFVWEPQCNRVTFCDSHPHQRTVPPRASQCIADFEHLLERELDGKEISCRMLPNQPVQRDKTSCGIILLATFRALLLHRNCDTRALRWDAPHAKLSHAITEGMLPFRKQILKELQAAIIEEPSLGGASQATLPKTPDRRYETSKSAQIKSPQPSRSTSLPLQGQHKASCIHSSTIQKPNLASPFLRHQHMASPMRTDPAPRQYHDAQALRTELKELKLTAHMRRAEAAG